MSDKPMPDLCPCGRGSGWCELTRAREFCRVASAELRSLPQPRYGVGIVGTTKPIVVLSVEDASRVVDLVATARPDRWVEARDLHTQEVVIRAEPRTVIDDDSQGVLL